MVFVFMTLEDMGEYPDSKRRLAKTLMATQGCAMVTQNLLLAAHIERLGTCVMCAPLFWPRYSFSFLACSCQWQSQMLVLTGEPTAV